MNGAKARYDAKADTVGPNLQKLGNLRNESDERARSERQNNANSPAALIFSLRCSVLILMTILRTQPLTYSTVAKVNRDHVNEHRMWDTNENVQRKIMKDKRQDLLRRRDVETSMMT